MITGKEFAIEAESSRYNGIPYSKLDCQAFVEEVLKNCGIRKTNGQPYNWKGSNSMWRNALEWKGTISECENAFGEIPPGAWVFIVKHDGGEKERGYNDDQGNASHVGIYTGRGSDPVRDSTKTDKRDGVGYRKLSGFTHVGLPYMISYSRTDKTEENAIDAVRKLRSGLTNDNDFLKAIIVLYDYLKGV